MTANTSIPQGTIEIEASVQGRNTREQLTFKRSITSNLVHVVIEAESRTLAFPVSAIALREAAGAVLDGPDAPPPAGISNLKSQI